MRIRASVTALTMAAGLLVALPATAEAASRLSFTAIGTADHYQGLLRAIGEISPAPAKGTAVYLQRYIAASKSWRDIGVGRTTGGTAVAITTKVGGSTLLYRLRVGARTSAGKTYSHYVWRGAFNQPVLATGGTTGHKLLVRPADISGTRSGSRLEAGRDGTSWVDVNTAGCLRAETFVFNQSDSGPGPDDGAARVSLLRGTTAVLSQSFWPRVRWNAMGRADIRGAHRLRLQLQGLSSYGPATESNLWLLCNNPGNKVPSAVLGKTTGGTTMSMATSGPEVGYYGSSMTIVGKLWHDYGPPFVEFSTGGEPVQLFRSPKGANRWTRILSTRLNAGGWYSYTTTRGVPYDYAIYYAGTSTWPRIDRFFKYSPPIQRKVVFDSLSSTKAAGRVFPAPPSGYAVYLQRLDNGKWVNVGVGRTSGGSGVTFASRSQVGKRYRLFAPFHPKPTYAAGASGVRALG